MKEAMARNKIESALLVCRLSILRRKLFWSTFSRISSFLKKKKKSTSVCCNRNALAFSVRFWCLTLRMFPCALSLLCHSQVTDTRSWQRQTEAKINPGVLGGGEAGHTSVCSPLPWARCNASCRFGNCFWGSVTNCSLLKAILLIDTRIIKAFKSQSLINGENLTTREWGNSEPSLPSKSISLLCPYISALQQALSWSHEAGQGTHFSLGLTQWTEKLPFSPCGLRCTCGFSYHTHHVFLEWKALL